MTKSIVYIDSEIGIDDKRIKDLGAIKNDRSSFHSPSLRDFYAFISDADFVCGHNIVHHDLAYLTPHFEKPLLCEPVDTLYLSPLLFPCRPYWYTPYIESDHHVDFENIPPEAEEVLSYATGEDLSQNGGIRY